MKEPVVNSDTLLAMFNLDEDQVDSLEFKNINGDAGLAVKLKRRNEPCPRCGCDTPDIKDYNIKQIKHAALTDRNCTLYYNARRYICPVCLRTYHENNPFVFKEQKISALTVKLVLSDLKKPGETFASVAARNNISPTSAASIFDSHVDMEPLKLTSRINIDECYAFSGKEGKYVLMILDDITGNPIDILPSRRKDYLLDYFRKLPENEKNSVEYICTDMYDVYRQVIKIVFKNAVHCVDRYHVSQEIHRKLDRVRIRVMNAFAERDRLAKKNGVMKKGESSDEYYLLKHFNWLMEIRPDKKDSKKIAYLDPFRERKFNNHFQRFMNYSEILDLLLVIDKDLTDAYRLKSRFNDFYDSADYQSAPDMLRKLIREFRTSSIPEMKECGKTLASWSQEIINSFITVDTEYKVVPGTGEVTALSKHMNNAAIERKNGILKLIKKAGCGYRNWERFRNRCLYVLRNDASFSISPIDEPRAQAHYAKYTGKEKP